MLKENKIEEVRNITNQRSIVLRDGEYLKSIDYVEYFKDDFSKIAATFMVIMDFIGEKKD